MGEKIGLPIWSGGEKLVALPPPSLLTGLELQAVLGVRITLPGVTPGQGDTGLQGGLGEHELEFTDESKSCPASPLNNFLRSVEFESAAGGPSSLRAGSGRRQN